MSEIKNYIRESRKHEADTLMKNIIEDLKSEGLSVEFGKIGLRASYALLYNEDHSIEIIGYTFIKSLEYYDEEIGKLKALQQALVRKKLAEQKSQSN